MAAYSDDRQRMPGPYYNLKHDPHPFTVDLHSSSPAAAPPPPPPPAPPPPLSLQAARPPRPPTNLRSCFAIFCYALIFIIAFIGLSMFILFLVYRPRVPRFSIQTFRVGDLNLTPDSTKNLSFVKFDISVTLNVWNPNRRLRLAYDSFRVGVLYEDEQLATASMPPFVQGKRNISVFSVVMVSPGSSVTKQTGNSLRADLDKDRITFAVGIGVEARLLLGYSRSLPFWVYTDCTVEVTSPSSPGGSGLLKNHCGSHG